MNPDINKYLFGMLACALSFHAVANVSTVEYSAMPAVDCVINPYRVVDISSPVAGVIKQVYVERSQPVTAGQVIAELDASVERANVALARYRAAVQSEIGLGQVNLSFDGLRKQRVDSLHESQNISRENADQIEREVQLSEWKLRQARELLEIRKLELRRAEEQLRQKSVRAPFDGFVLDTFKFRGEYVEEQAILRLAQLDPLVIETIVPMEYFGTIVSGMLAEIQPEILLREKLIGTVTVVDRIGDTASNTFGVKLSIPNPENRIPAGLKCIVKFFAPPTENLAAVSPADPGPSSAGGKTGNIATASVAAENAADIPADRAARPAEMLASIVDNPVIATPPEFTEAEIKFRDDGVQRQASPNPGDESATPPTLAKMPNSYLVMIPPPDSEAAAQQLVQRLQAAGVDDFLKYDYGVNKGMISLGVFKTRAYAVARQQQMDGLGFKTYTVERY